LLPPNPEGDDVRLAIEAFHLADDGDPFIIDEGELCIIDEGERSIAGSLPTSDNRDSKQ
jgi:hypothetical protein